MPAQQRAPAVLAVIGLALAARAACADPAGFAFLEVPAGARASALGGAYASLAQGAEAVYWNPAGLSGTRGVELTASHYEFFQSLRHDQFAIATHRLGGGLAASIRAQYSEPITARDEIGNEIGTFGSHDLDFALGYGAVVAPGLSLGGATQYVRERIADDAAGTWAFDLGAGWDPGEAGGLQLALAAQNLGPAAHFTIDGAPGEPVPLPAAVQGGCSYAVGLGPTLGLRAALEARLTRGRNGIGLLGAELESPGTGAAFRLGWRVNDSASTLSVGAGYERHALRFDYAFVPYRLDLGDTHRLSFAARF